MTYLILAFLLATVDLSLEEKVGQLLMTSVYPDQTDEEPEPYLETYHPGHLLFVGNHWDPAREKKLICRYQSKSKFPLTIAQDLEWGLAQRLDNVVVFPKNGALGWADPADLFLMGKEIARECHILGVNLNLAPVVDVNNNPQNQVIKDRSFGRSPHEVAKRALAVMHGMQSGGLKTCAKHFPGHGNTQADSHYELPTITLNYEELKQVELAPFKAMIEGGTDAVMTAHIALPQIDPKSLAASLSPIVIKQILQHDLGFQGIVITDDLLMGAISNHLGFGEAAVQAFLAGNDILLFTNYTPGKIESVRTALKEAHEALVSAVKTGRISESELNQRVKKIFTFKEGLFYHQEEGPLITPEALKLSEKLTSPEGTLGCVGHGSK